MYAQENISIYIPIYTIYYYYYVRCHRPEEGRQGAARHHEGRPWAITNHSNSTVVIVIVIVRVTVIGIVIGIGIVVVIVTVIVIVIGIVIGIGIVVVIVIVIVTIITITITITSNRNIIRPRGLGRRRARGLQGPLVYFLCSFLIIISIL